MLSDKQIDIFKHSLGASIVLCIYIAQVCHLYHLVGIGLLVFTYLFALLAYYCILYGCESRLFRMVTRESKRLYRFLKVGVIVVNVFLSMSEHFASGVIHYQSIVSIVLQSLLFLFIALFPEFLLPLLFDIQHDDGGLR